MELEPLTMTRLRRVIAALWIAVMLPVSGLYGQHSADRAGVLLLAHGGSKAWNDHVSALAAKVDGTLPTEVAFGMASRAAIQEAVDRLAARGVTRITAVPLFVSSHSSVITSTEYLLGLRAEAPPELAIFARMTHGGGGGHDAHAAHAAPADPAARVTLPVPVRMTKALDADAAVSDVLITRAREISRDPAREAIVLVAHGPVRDEENRLWLRDLAVHVDRLKQAVPFASVEALTVRDDAPAPIRDAATAELRAVVSRQIGEGRRVLIVPVLLSFGGIEAGIRKRLEGLDYTMATKGLIPDDRFIAWVLGKAEATPPR
jgi:sirohydrochlorin ferrochelatase